MPRKKGRRRERPRKKEDRKKAGVTSLETRSVKRNTRTRVANNETKGERRKKRKKKREEKKEALENPGETWTRFNGAFKFFRFFLEGEGNNWGRKGIDPGEERDERA